ncbi:hypothetical protein ACVWW3_001958 [Bradyrhizobium sp. LM2.9]
MPVRLSLPKRRTTRRSTTTERWAPCSPGDHAGRGDAAVGANLLLDLGLDDIERHAHQGCGDLGLLLLIVGDADGGEDRLVQGRRIVAHAPRAIFGIPVCVHNGLVSMPGYLVPSMLHCNMNFMWQLSYAPVGCQGGDATPSTTSARCCGQRFSAARPASVSP